MIHCGATEVSFVPRGSGGDRYPMRRGGSKQLWLRREAVEFYGRRNGERGRSGIFVFLYGRGINIFWNCPFLTYSENFGNVRPCHLEKSKQKKENDN